MSHRTHTHTARKRQTEWWLKSFGNSRAPRRTSTSCLWGRPGPAKWLRLFIRFSQNNNNGNQTGHKQQIDMPLKATNINDAPTAQKALWDAQVDGKWRLIGSNLDWTENIIIKVIITLENTENKRIQSISNVFRDESKLIDNFQAKQCCQIVTLLH